MPKLTIDGREVTVRDGATIMDAAAELGVFIPRFCHHPALSPAGSCRMCVVEVEGAPKPVTACSTPAAEGMRVLTGTPAVAEARRAVLEFLLLNHPLDCPICDQAGECALQDYYMDYSRAKSRFPAEAKERRQKRRAVGPHLVLDNERCVLCTRCVRFCDEVTRTSELFVSGRSDASFIDVKDGAPDNPYSLNLADICPVGALTSREFRFKERAWRLGRSPVTCLGCATGCQAEAHHSGNVIHRLVPRPDPETNTWLCDRGRLSYKAVRAGDRLSKGVIKNGLIDLEPALREAAARLAAAPGAAVLGSPWLSIEDNAALAGLARTLGTENFCFDFPAGKGIKDGILINDDPAPNTAGAAEVRAAFGGLTLAELSSRVASGQVKAVITEARAAAFIKQALKAGPRLIVFATNRADIPPEAYATLPYASYFEAPGTFINYRGLRRAVKPAVAPPDGVLPLAEVAGRLAREAAQYGGEK